MTGAPLENIRAALLWAATHLEGNRLQWDSAIEDLDFLRSKSTAQAALIRKLGQVMIFNVRGETPYHDALAAYREWLKENKEC